MVKKTQCPACLVGEVVCLSYERTFDVMASTEGRILAHDGFIYTPVTSTDFWCPSCDTQWDSWDEFMDEYEPQVLILAETLHG